MNIPVREGETIEGSRTTRNRPYPVLKCSRHVRFAFVCVRLDVGVAPRASGHIDVPHAAWRPPRAGVGPLHGPDSHAKLQLRTPTLLQLRLATVGRPCTSAIDWEFSHALDTLHKMVIPASHQVAMQSGRRLRHLAHQTWPQSTRLS